jgi:hypothetical protein
MKNNLKKYSLILVFILYGLTCSAKYSRTCMVKYETSSGWSKTYELVVNFYSGTELNKLTKSYNYSTYETYALIWWDEESVSTIKLDRNICMYSDICGYKEFSTEYYSSSEGEDLKGVNWKICWSGNCY